MKIYIVYHEYQVDGGFGDAIYEEDVIACFFDKETAEEFVNKYDNPHVYDRPYDEVSCGSLYVQEEEIFKSVKEAEESKDFKNYAINYGVRPFEKMTDEEKRLDEEEHDRWKRRRGLV